MIDALASVPNSVSIFAQLPGIPFVAFSFSLIPLPIPGRVRLDLADTEDVVQTYEITRNPVERVTSQNKTRNPKIVRVTGALSADSLSTPLLPALGLLRLDKRELRKLHKLADRHEPLYVVTPEDQHGNMAITEIVEHYDKTTGRGVALTITFEEFQIAGVGLVSSVLDMDALGTGAGTAADLGPQTPDTSAAAPLTSNGPSAMSSTERASVVSSTPELDDVLL